MSATSITPDKAETGAHDTGDASDPKLVALQQRFRAARNEGIDGGADNPVGSPEMARRGLMMVLSSPSGAGKTTIARHLLAANPEMEISVSVTTRPMRPGEADGVDYHFIDESDYRLLVEHGELLEHALVFGNYYGTPRAPVEAALKAGRDVLFDIDWQGTQQLKENAPHDLVTVFILPPSAEELLRRLKSRAQDSDDVIERRMGQASGEMSHHSEYDYVIINRDLEASVGTVQTILTAERLKRVRQTGLIPFVRTLQQGL